MLRVETDLDGSLWLRSLSLIFADTLQRLPEYLESEDPTVRERWFPRTYRDDGDEEQWRQYGGEELEHLFASNVEIVRKDLARMEPEDPAEIRPDDADAIRPDDADAIPVSYALRIPAPHKSAWQSALNGASHAIFLSSGLAPDELEREPGTLGDHRKDHALLRVHLLTIILSMIVEAEGYGYDPELTEEDPL